MGNIHRLTAFAHYISIFWIILGCSSCGARQAPYTPSSQLIGEPQANLTTNTGTDAISGEVTHNPLPPILTDTPFVEKEIAPKQLPPIENSTSDQPNFESNQNIPPPNEGEEFQLPTQIPSKPQFDRFVDQVKNGKSEQIVGVYIENVLSLRVIQQPQNNPNFVSNVKGIATQFILAYQIAGNIGLLAHNYLSGTLFFNIKVGDVAQIIYGDGNVDEYEVTDYHEYQALSPNSPNSDFIDLSSGEKISAGELFNRIYTGTHRLVFQTCIAQDNVDTWGRLFVISFPY